MTDTTTIQPGEVYAIAIQTLPPEDIDHHYSDLYLKVTPTSRALVERIPLIWNGGRPSFLSIFISQIDGCKWYDLPFCYLNICKRKKLWRNRL